MSASTSTTSASSSSRSYAPTGSLTTLQSVATEPKLDAIGDVSHPAPVYALQPIKPIPSSEPYYDVGAFSRPVSTSITDCQAWFDRGLAWCYSFHLEEAIVCFERAIAHDPTCAMAYWGLAYALGPHYNNMWRTWTDNDLERTLTRANEVIGHAKQHQDKATPVERALIEALDQRYPLDWRDKAYSRWNEVYADAMQVAYEQFPDDLDVAALYAESMMNLTPWKLWDLCTGLPTPNSRAQAARVVIERSMRDPGYKTHIGLLHLWVHLIEMTLTPELGLDAADRLRALVPDGGHLLHMPSHIDVLMGDYRRAVMSNQLACRADELYLAKSGPQNFYTAYRLHNYHSLIYAAMFAGQYAVCMDAVERLERSLPESVLRAPGMANILESFIAVRPHVYIRFGKWEEVFSIHIPEDKELYCGTVAIIHYARGVAHAAMGNVAEAEEEQKLFTAAYAAVSPERLRYPNTNRDVIHIAQEMLAGEIEYRKGHFELGFDHLRKAVKLEEELIYSEPASWMQPPRHAYAALQMEQGNLEEAAKAYAEDLGWDNALPRAKQHPNNVWALHGYYEVLKKMGRDGEARMVMTYLKPAMAAADVKIMASCACSQSAGAGKCDMRKVAGKKRGTQDFEGSQRKEKACC